MQERRVFERFPVDFSLKFKDLDNKREGIGTIINISASGGGLFLTTEELHPGAHLEIWLLIPDNKEPFHTKGEVVWLERTQAAMYKVGVKFDSIDFLGISRALRANNARFKDSR